MAGRDLHAAVIRQAAHEAVRALLAAPPGSMTGPFGLVAATSWLKSEHCLGAVVDLAEELAIDLAVAVDALGTAEAARGADRQTAGLPTPQPDTPAGAIDRATVCGLAAERLVFRSFG
jgi:hypothetical protein